MDAKTPLHNAEEPVEPARWRPELGANGRVEIFAAYFHDNAGRFVSEAISVERFKELLLSKGHKFQHTGDPPPDNYPTLEEVEAYLEGKLQPVSREGSNYKRPVDPNKEIKRDPPAYLLPARVRTRLGIDTPGVDDDEQPEPIRLIRPVQQKPSIARPAVVRKPVTPPPPAPVRVPVDRITAVEKKAAFKKASEVLWERGAKHRPLTIADIVDEALNHLPKGKVINKDSLITQLYRLLGKDERAVLCDPRKASS